jgi:hypothetical protein
MLSVIILTVKYAKCHSGTFSPVFYVFLWVVILLGQMKTSYCQHNYAEVSLY